VRLTIGAALPVVVPPTFIPTPAYVAGPQNTAFGTILDNETGAPATSSAHGVLVFTDPDTLDFHSASFSPQHSGYVGSFALDPVDQVGNSVGWTFSVSDAVVASLAPGQALTQNYDVTIDDGHDGTLVQTVSVTIGSGGFVI